MNKKAYQLPVTEVAEALTVTTYLQTPSAPDEGIHYEDDPDPSGDDPTAKEREDETTWGNLW